MFTNRNAEDIKLQAAIDRLYENMAEDNTSSATYSTRADQLIKLYSLKDNQSKSGFSPDTLLAVLGNLFGIGIIVGHERAHVVTSKALAFVRQAR
jgi:hypothetical protein